MTLTEQNNGQAWRDCDDAGLRHLWRKTDVDRNASANARARARNEGWYVCARAACPRARFGKEVRA